MIERVQSEAAPWGGAVLLSTQADEDTDALILATASATAPDPTNYGAARVVHDGILRWPSDDWRHTQLASSGRPWWQVPDLHTPALLDGVTIHYHVFERTAPATFEPAITVQATPDCLTSSERVLARDVVKGRLLYHLTRALAAGDLPPVNEDDYIPIQEKEALVEGHPIPIILVKERATPSGAMTIGRHRASTATGLDGKTYREYSRRVRSTVELLLVCDTPQHRTEIGAFLHNVLEQDVPYYQIAGLEEVSVQSFDRHEIEGNREFYFTELTFECEGELVIREELRVTVVSMDVEGCRNQ